MTGPAPDADEPTPPLVVGYLRADTPAGAAPLLAALARHAEVRGLGHVARVFRDPASGEDTRRPGFAACLQVCATARRAIILVPTPEHLASNDLLTGALVAQARGVNAAITHLDGRPATRQDWARDQSVSDPRLAPATDRTTPPSPHHTSHDPGDPNPHRRFSG